MIAVSQSVGRSLPDLHFASVRDSDGRWVGGGCARTNFTLEMTGELVNAHQRRVADGTKDGLEDASLFGAASIASDMCARVSQSTERLSVLRSDHDQTYRISAISQSYESRATIGRGIDGSTASSSIKQQQQRQREQQRCCYATRRGRE